MPRTQPPRTAPEVHVATAAAAPCAGESGPCGCGPGARAVGVDPKLKAANLRQLKRIEGQVRGIARMVQDDRYCSDIVTQIAAARQSLHTVSRNLLANHLKHCATAAMREPGEAHDAMVAELLDLVSKLSK